MLQTSIFNVEPVPYHLSNMLSLNCGKQHLYLALFMLRDTRWSVQDVQYLYFSLVLLPILLIPSLFCILVWLLCLTLFHVLLCFCYFVSLIVQRTSVHKALLCSQLHLCHRLLGDLICLCTNVSSLQDKYIMFVRWLCFVGCINDLP